MAVFSDTVFGAPCWVSLLTRDLEAAQNFYGAVLGWDFRPDRRGENFCVALQDGAPVGGLGVLAGQPAAVAWTPYFAVIDANTAAERIRERSATVAVGPLSFGTGRAALAADRDGATFGIWQGRLQPGWRIGARKAPAWLELRTRDAFEAAVFYGQVLDWASERPGSCQVSYEGSQVVLRHGHDIVARISGGAVRTAPDPLVRPRWHVHFSVADLDAAVAQAERHAGRLVPPVLSTPTDRRATLADPDGALFTITVRNEADGRAPD
ncbi:VOC family protein [Streptomyces sp. NPDC006460]|uniref:VOC family protein n=1 Tax=Streptomyces sp. NPDC006460 TaxID=3154304 RepID=UPI0033BAA2C9